MEDALTASFSRHDPGWIGEGLYIGRYEDAVMEFSPELLHEIRSRTGRAEIVAVSADISGRIDGTAEAFGFCTRLLRQHQGWALDEYTDHLWTLAELESNASVEGHPFFDHSGWYGEIKKLPGQGGECFAIPSFNKRPPKIIACDHILLSGLRNLRRIEDYISQSLIDIVYAEAIGSDQIEITFDDGTALRRDPGEDSDVRFLIDVLREFGEDQYTMKFVLIEPTEKSSA